MSAENSADAPRPGGDGARPEAADGRFERARIDPGSVFENPDKVLEDDSLTRDQKIAVLRRWAYDEAELQVAEDEGMQGTDKAAPGRARAALLRLGVDGEDLPGDTRHGC